ALIALMLGHIYIGSIGMEGAYGAMGTGEIDLSWAMRHHRARGEEQRAKGRIAVPPADGRSGRAAPAERALNVVIAGLALAVAAGSAVGLTLPSASEPAGQACSTSTTGVDDPGSNLVGPDWRPEK